MRYFVDDFLPEHYNKLKYVFLLESPYKDEICHHIPLAGNSGKAVTKKLKPYLCPAFNNEPFGLYLQKSGDERFGIMNCSRKPMDLKYYVENEKVYDKCEVDVLNRIRKNPKTTLNKRKKEIDNVAHKRIIDDLESRITNIDIINKSFIIVACGILSKKILSDIKLSKEHMVLYTPHPSFNQWYRKINQHDIVLLDESLNRNL